MVVAVYAWESGQTAGYTHDTVVPRSVHIVLGLREGFKEAALASFLSPCLLTVDRKDKGGYRSEEPIVQGLGTP